MIARTALGGYALLGGLAKPLVALYLRRRMARGREDPQRMGERLGKAGQPRPAGPLVWLHAASVGEAVSLLPVVERLRRDWPQLTVLMTSGTVTSAKLMAEQLPAGAIHQYVPVDLPSAVRAFLAHWQPALGLMVESELWPNLLRESTKAGVDLVLLNGRVSPTSFRSWRRARPLIAELLGQFSLVMARSQHDQEQLQELGAPAVICAGDLKAAAPPLSADPVALEELHRAIGVRPLWLAASTHPGEETVVGQVHRALTTQWPDLLTIVVPRHPERGPEISAVARDLELSVAQRSRGDLPTAETALYLADTLGEMGLWYRLAEIVFVGGSLVPIGGHNLLEPAKLDCALVAGPHTGKIRVMAQEMAAAGALHQVSGAADLEQTLSTLLRDAEARRALVGAAADYAKRQAGVLDRTMEALLPALARAAARR